MKLAALETYTMISLLAVGNLLILVFVLAYHGLRSGKHRALIYFMVSRLLLGVGWILILNRGVWSDLLTIYGGNLFLIFGVATESVAFISHRGRSPSTERSFLAAAAAGSLLFVLFARSPSLIVGVGGVAAGLLTAATTVILLRQSRETILLRFVGILYGILTLSFAIRALYGFLGVLEHSVSQATLQSIFFLPVFAVFFAGSTAMVLLLKEQDERALQESYDKYDVLFRSNLSAVFLSDPQTGVALEANPRSQELTGYSPHEIQGRTFTELGLWLPGERDKAETIYREQGRLVNHEMQARTRNGEERTWLVASGRAQLRDRPVLATTILDITDRKVMENRIHGLVAERDLLLREVHHRVRNNLTQISSALSLQAHRTPEPDAAEALTSAVNRIAAMLSLYDQVYTSGGESRLPVRDYFERLIQRLRSAFPTSEHITVSMEVEDIELSPRTVSSLGQLVNELFTNSMKHAFHDRSQGIIRVALTRDAVTPALLLEYEDDGPGLPAAAAPATDDRPSGSDSFGAILIEALASQLNATWETGPPPGVHYRFRFHPAI